jgi:hypothetical protein
MNCEQYRDLLNRHLDGEAAADALPAHARHCRDCAALYHGAQRLAQALPYLKPPAPPRELKDFILLEMREANRRRFTLRVHLTATSLAAAMMLLVLVPSFFWPRPLPTKSGEQVVVANTQPPPEAPQANLRDTVNQASQAVTQLTARTADETVGQTKSLWPMMTPPLDDWDKPPQLEPSARPLTETGQSAVVAIEPVTNSAKRAFGMLLHDMQPADQPTKPGS